MLLPDFIFRYFYLTTAQRVAFTLELFQEASEQKKRMPKSYNRVGVKLKPSLMPTVSVYGNKPDTGPGMLAARAVCEDLNLAHPTWGVQVAWTRDNTQYTTAVPTRAILVAAVSAEFPQYNVA